MFKTLNCCLFLLLVAVLVLFSASATLAQAQQQERPTLEERIFTIKHGDVAEIYRMVRTFITPYGEANADRDSSIIVVRDTPEGIARVAEIIARMDIPPDSIRLTFFIFTAAKGPGLLIPGGLPGNVDKGLREVGQVMAFQDFRLVGRGMLSLASTAKNGDLSVASDIGNVRIRFNPNYNLQSKILKLEELMVSIQYDGGGANPFRTDVVVEDGGISVVGASKLDGGEEALLVIVSMDVERIGQ